MTKLPGWSVADMKEIHSTQVLATLDVSCSGGTWCADSTVWSVEWSGDTVARLYTIWELEGTMEPIICILATRGQWSVMSLAKCCPYGELCPL